MRNRDAIIELQALLADLRNTREAKLPGLVGGMFRRRLEALEYGIEALRAYDAAGIGVDP